MFHREEEVWIFSSPASVFSPDDLSRCPPPGIFCCGPDDEPGRHLYRNVTLDMLRQHEKPLRPNTFAANTRPKLSIIAARWGGHTKTNTKESELLSTNPNYLFSLLDIGVRPLLGWNYEVWSLWIGKDEDAQDVSGDQGELSTPMLRMIFRFILVVQEVSCRWSWYFSMVVEKWSWKRCPFPTVTRRTRSGDQNVHADPQTPDLVSPVWSFWVGKDEDAQYINPHRP